MGLDHANDPDLICALAEDMKTHGIKPEIKVFDVSMIQNVLDLADQDLIYHSMHFDFVLGLKGAIPATIENLVHLKNTIPRQATWTVAGIGANQLPMVAHMPLPRAAMDEKRIAKAIYNQILSHVYVITTGHM